MFDRIFSFIAIALCSNQGIFAIRIKLFWRNSRRSENNSFICTKINGNLHLLFLIKIYFKYAFRCLHGQDSKIKIIILNRDMIFKHDIIIKFGK